MSTSALIYFLKLKYNELPSNFSLSERKNVALIEWKALSAETKKKFEIEASKDWAFDPHRKECAEKINMCVYKIKNSPEISNSTVSLIKVPKHRIDSSFLVSDSNDHSIIVSRKLLAKSLSEQSTILPLNDTFILKHIKRKHIEETNENIKVRVEDLQLFAVLSKDN